MPQISKIKVTETKTEFEALLVEARCIRELGPKYNSRLTDDKSPLYIVITDENFPRLLTARKTDLGGVGARSVYGPFLSGETVRRILKVARKLFPFCNQPRRHLERPKGVERSNTPGRDFARNDVKSTCFYRHLGLCPGVCSGEISARQYLSIIKKLEQFLGGDFAGLKAKLEKEMRAAAKKQKFENAAKARDAAEALGSLALAGEQEEGTRISPIDRLKSLIKLLKHLDVSHSEEPEATKNPDGILPPRQARGQDDVNSFRIEGFDVSNLGGRLATAAMAVFIGGIREIGEYRHFRIKSRRHLERPKGVERSSVSDIRSVAAGDLDSSASLRSARNDVMGDDPRMIAEAVERRMLHPEWGKPDLVVIDGGGPQLRRIRKDILYLGLAKSPDRLVIPAGAGFKTVRVSGRDLGVQLLQQVRDEAHRFSRRLHLKLRRKMLIG